MKKRHLWLIAVVVLVVVATLSLAACGGSTTTTVGPTGTAGPATTAGPTTTAAGAATTTGGAVDAAALFEQYCAGCHQNVPSVSADTAKSVIQSGKRSMPGFGDQLTPDEVAALATWVANGGK
jgi:mono/diheme cytochrome c family protein